MEAQVTIPFPPDLFEALARRIAELLAERPEAQRYMDADEAAAYLGIPVKTLRTKEWRDREGIPYGQLGGGRLIFDPSMSVSPRRAGLLVVATQLPASPVL